MKAKLSIKDSVQCTFYTNYERTARILIMLKKKLFFVEEKGFLHKTHNIILEIPYEKIREETSVGYDLIIIDVEGKKYAFRVSGVSALVVEKYLKELMPVPVSSS